MSTPIASTGTLVARAPAATPFIYTTIAELGDLTPPEMTRKEFDASVHNKKIDVYVLGLFRRGAVAIPLNFIPQDPTHSAASGLYAAIIANSIDGYRFTYPDGTVYIMSGQVQSIKPKAPVDGKLAADVTIRMSDKMYVDGVLVG